MRKPEEFIYTQSGRVIHPDDLSAEHVDLNDIATSLGAIDRFNGHSGISVLRHSIGVAKITQRKFGHAYPDIFRIALLHDAAESYCMDVPVPKKKFMKPEWKEWSNFVENEIYLKFNLKPTEEELKLVNRVDKAVIPYEMSYAFELPRSEEAADGFNWSGFGSAYLWNVDDKDLVSVYTYLMEQP